MNTNSIERAQQRLDFVRAELGAAASDPVRASSDAGFRSYWRTRAADGRHLVLMDSPPQLEDVRPWLRLHALLLAGGVRVPTVLARDIDAGFLLLEDLGGPTLLQTINAGNADHWFAHAREQLLRIQHIPLPDALPRYDEALVRRELALFEDWFLGTHLGITLSDAERRAFAASSEHLVDAFVSSPRVLVHRDYMPRNLMPLHDGVAVLDFQDAVGGPPAYDVASLFKDAFLSWPEARVGTWINAFRDAMADGGLPVPDAATFRKQVALVGAQRHLKVLGIFARLQHRDSKPRYLADAPRFVAYLAHTLPEHPELQAINDILTRHVLPRIAPMELPQ